MQNSSILLGYKISNSKKSMTVSGYNGYYLISQMLMLLPFFKEPNHPLPLMALLSSSRTSVRRDFLLIRRIVVFQDLMLYSSNYSKMPRCSCSQNKLSKNGWMNSSTQRCTLSSDNIKQKSITINIIFTFFMIKLLLLCVLFTAAATYNARLALDLAYMSDIAYESGSSIAAWNCSLCHRFNFTGVKMIYNQTTSVQGFTGYSPVLNAIIVCFRGSMDVKNWIVNLDTLQTDHPACNDCKAHKGFYDAYRGVSPILKSEVSKLLAMYRGAEVLMTGHSLGGALTALASYDLLDSHYPVNYVYTYGQPRVGNREFSTAMETLIGQKHFRVIDYRDIVPHLPPAQFAFYHYGHQIWYHPEGMQEYSQCTSEDPKCSNSLIDLSVDDHSLTRYTQMKVDGFQGKFWIYWRRIVSRYVRKQTGTMEELAAVKTKVREMKKEIQ